MIFCHVLSNKKFSIGAVFLLFIKGLCCIGEKIYEWKNH